MTVVTNSTIYSGNVSGDGTIVISGPSLGNSTLTLSGNNGGFGDITNQSGTFNVSYVTLAAANPNALSSNSSIYVSGTETASNQLVLVANSTNYVMGRLLDSGNLAITSGSTNNFIDVITFAEGAITTQSGSAGKMLIVSSNTIVVIGTNNAYFNNPGTNTGYMDLGFGGNKPFAFNGNGSVVINVSLSDSNGGFSTTAGADQGGFDHDLGTGTITLNAPSFYTGGTTNHTGTLLLGTNFALPQSGGQPNAQGCGVTMLGGIINMNGTAEQVSVVNLSGGSILGGGTLSAGGNGTLTANFTFNISAADTNVAVINPTIETTLAGGTA